jgi:hypothetical protein
MAGRVVSCYDDSSCSGDRCCRLGDGTDDIDFAGELVHCMKCMCESTWGCFRELVNIEVDDFPR